MSIPPNSNDPSCECIAQLEPDTYSYFDSCLDGGITYYYELKTFRDNELPLYRGCSWPAMGQGTPSGGQCTGDMAPSAPIVIGCDSCVLRWEDYSWNEEGFVIQAPGDEICDWVDPNVEEYRVNNCCTGKYGYFIGAYNEYGITWSQPGMPCIESPDCQPKLGCDGSQYEIPLMSKSGNLILICLIIITTVCLYYRKQKNRNRLHL